MHPLRLAIRHHWPLLGLVLSRDTLMLLETFVPATLSRLTELRHNYAQGSDGTERIGGVDQSQRSRTAVL